MRRVRVAEMVKLVAANARATPVPIMAFSVTSPGVSGQSRFTHALVPAGDSRNFDFSLLLLCNDLQ